MTSGTHARRLGLPAVFIIIVALATWAYLSDLTGIGSWVALAAVGVGTFYLRDLRRTD